MHLFSSLLPCILLAATIFTGADGLSNYTLKKGPLDTPWTDKVGTNPWPEHPRPLLQRKDWKNLNGVWQYKKTDAEGINAPPFGADLEQSVLVPFCLESALSGIMGKDTIHSWYRTTFDVPSSWAAGNRVLLNFGAVDYEATVFVNGRKLLTHTGGYWEFSVDVTDHLSKNGTNELMLFVYDPTDMGDIQVPIGKQTLNPSHIFYTPCSGIWQTVWLESAPANHITSLHVNADMHGKVNMTVKGNNASTPVEVTIYEPNSTNIKATGRGTSGFAFEFTVDSPSLWSPSSPTLYNMTVKLGNDTVQSYTGFRTISRGVIDGVQRPLLNGEFIFQFGTLDQGYWPDGIYTAPNREAMIYDLQILKKIGYNMVRKHIKVEPALFYRACDELGLLVIQDMPSLRTGVQREGATCPDYIPVGKESSTVEFARQLELMVQQLKSYPSIVTWVIYNEGWGQPRGPPYPELSFTERIRALDPTRLINAVSGWHDHGASDFHDNHKYANPQCGTPFYSLPATPYDPSRIGLQGEFGGIGHNASIENMWSVPRSLASIPETYELDATLSIWNYRAHTILSELREQIDRFACSAAVWTQTTDVEGEVNGMMTYDRRVLRVDLEMWGEDLRGLFEAGRRRAGGGGNGNGTMVQGGKGGF